MFIQTRNTLINTDLLEAITIEGTSITYHMSNNDIVVNYGSEDATKRAQHDIIELLGN